MRDICDDILARYAMAPQAIRDQVIQLLASLLAVGLVEVVG